MLITRTEIDGVSPLDVRLAGGAIAEIGRELARGPGEPVLDAAGGALLPGLHDHHLHLMALAAAQTSVRCGPPAVRDLDGLASALAASGGSGEWVRGIGYHQSVAGDLDRAQLDRLLPDRPARIQHRSGAMWVLNSAGVDRLGLDHGVDQRGVERDADGRATGRLFRLDAWLRERLGPERPPSLADVGRRLARLGVTGLTDATPGNSGAELRALVASAERGELRQRLLVMGEPGLPRPAHVSVARGAVKLLLDELVTIVGPMLAAIFPAIAAQAAASLGLITRGLVLILFLIFEPRGLAHRWEMIEAYFNLWPFSHRE